MIKFFLLFIFIPFTHFSTSANELSRDSLNFGQNKKIPKEIEKNVLTALSHYPELQGVSIKFVFKDNIRGSVMQAQPTLSSIFKSRDARSYRVNISAMLKLTNSALPIYELPDNIMIGWIAHELAHIMDYEQRSKLGLIRFGFAYLFSKKFKMQGESFADTFAVDRGLGNYILDTKRFILDHSDLPREYKNKISSIYLSPDAIIEQVRVIEEAGT